MIGRMLVVIAILATSAVYLAAGPRSEVIQSRRPLAELPWVIDGWAGRRAADFDARTLDVLRVDEYISRVYEDRATRRAVGLYVGYYASQREGTTMHSPLNCLPGAGWTASTKQSLAISLPDPNARSIEVNRLIISKGLDRQLVLYWYQSHDRIIASEYWGKFYLVVDAIRLNRTDGALVRVVAPIQESTERAEKEAEERAVKFVRAAFPLLAASLPS